MIDESQVQWLAKIAVFLASTFALMLSAQEPDRDTLTRKLLLQRKEYQMQHSKGLTVFHDFEFRDSYEQSGINFTNRGWMMLPKTGNPLIMITEMPWLSRMWMATGCSNPAQALWSPVF